MTADETRSRNLELLREVFVAISEGRHDEMVGFMADDLVFELPFGPAGMPSRFEGKERFRALQASVFPLFSRFQIELQEVHPALDPEALVAEYRSDAVVAASAREYQNRYIGVLRFRDGEIAFWREFHNPELATAALSAQPASDEQA